MHCLGFEPMILLLAALQSVLLLQKCSKQRHVFYGSFELGFNAQVGSRGYVYRFTPKQNSNISHVLHYNLQWIKTFGIAQNCTWAADIQVYLKCSKRQISYKLSELTRVNRTMAICDSGRLYFKVYQMPFNGILVVTKNPNYLGLDGLFLVECLRSRDKSAGLFQNADATSTSRLANFRRGFQIFTLNEQQLHAGWHIR